VNAGITSIQRRACDHVFFDVLICETLGNKRRGCPLPHRLMRAT
jgi:hypothetical protein